MHEKRDDRLMIVSAGSLTIGVAIGVMSLGTPAFAADREPGRPPERPNPRETIPQPLPPSTMDPGIQKEPPTVPSPESAVKPPSVDPEMAVDPEKTPPASAPNIPQQYEPKAKPPRQK